MKMDNGLDKYPLLLNIPIAHHQAQLPLVLPKKSVHKLANKEEKKVKFLKTISNKKLKKSINKNSNL
jgi:hypothetical protein